MTPPAAREGAPRSPYLAACLVAVVVLAAAIAGITPHPVGVFWDDGVYLLSAKALAAGDGYRYTFLPGSPPAIHYPPAFPLLLAGLIKVTPEFPANVAILKLLNPLLLAAGVFGAVRLGVKSAGLGEVHAALAVGICALAAPVLVLANVLLSEALFLAVLVGALLLVDAAVERGGMRAAVLAGGAIGALTLVRTLGGVLLPATVLALLLRRRRGEAALVLVCAIALLAPWQIWVWTVSPGFPDELRGSYGPYLEWVIGGYQREPALIWQVWSRNAEELWRTFGIIFAPRLPAVVQHAAAAVVFAALGAGLVALRRRGGALAPFLAIYGLVVLLWPYSPDRFVWAVWPLAGILILAAARDIGQWSAVRWTIAPRAAIVAAGLLFAGHAAYAARGLAGGWAGVAQRTMADRMWPLVEWTVTHAAPEDIVASDAHVMIALYTGRRTMPVSILTPAEHVRSKPTAQYANELSALAKRFAPRLLVLSRGTPELMAVPTWAAAPGAPRVTPLAPIPGGGSAFALRARQ